MAEEPLNPYAPPQNLDSLGPQQQPLPPPIYVRPYESTRGKATLAVWATIISLIVQIMILASLYWQHSLLQGAKNGIDIAPAAADANDSRQRSLQVVFVISALANLATLLIWIYGANANLRALGCPDVEFTPAWSVGWFFVPLLNFFKPYQVVREIWRGSDPSFYSGMVPSGTALIGWWWGLRICAAILGQLASLISNHAESVDELLGVTWLAIAINLAVGVPLHILQALLILTTQGFQDERHALIGSQSGSTPSIDSVNPLSVFR
jgi:hypothetical protein